jgi:histidinol-phosphate aminotransferase
VDEAFVEFAGDSIVGLVPEYDNLLVSRTLSKAHSLAGFRVGYAVLPEAVATDLNTHDDAYPLARPSQAAAIATLEHDATDVAERLRERDVYVKPLDDDRIGPGYVRVTTARPEENARVVDAFEEVLSAGGQP